MPEIARFESRRRLRGSVVLGGVIAAFALLFVTFFPSIEQIDVEEYSQAMPELFRELFDIRAMASIEGFLAVELYQFVWVLLLPLYLAYLGAGIVAGSADEDRLDVELSLPVTRPQLLWEKATALAPILVVPNLVVPPVVYLGVLAIGESVAVGPLLAVHALSVPYLATAAALGVLASVVLLDGDLARRGAVGVFFALYLLESLSTVADQDWLGAVSPARYYDPTEIMVDAEYDLVGAAILGAMTAGLLAVAAVRFRRVDAP